VSACGPAVDSKSVKLVGGPGCPYSTGRRLCSGPLIQEMVSKNVQILCHAGGYAQAPVFCDDGQELGVQELDGVTQRL